MVDVFTYRDSVLQSDQSVDCGAIHKNLSTIIKDTLDIPKGSSFDKHIRTVVYVMASIADEIFLNISWPGKTYWEEHMLEKRFFGSQVAGEKIFDDIDTLLANHQLYNSDLTEIYVKSLALGFKGKYRGIAESEKEIDEYRKQLFIVISKHDHSVDLSNDRIFQHEYDKTLPTIHRQFLPDTSIVNYVCVFFIFMFIVISSLAWMLETRPLNNVLREISVMILRK